VFEGVCRSLSFGIKPKLKVISPPSGGQMGESKRSSEGRLGYQMKGRKKSERPGGGKKRPGYPEGEIPKNGAQAP